MSVNKKERNNIFIWKRHIRYPKDASYFSRKDTEIRKKMNGSYLQLRFNIYSKQT